MWNWPDCGPGCGPPARGLNCGPRRAAGWCAADADLLLDLLCNLVQNAVKASAEGAPFEVRCLPGAGTVTLEVADHGCGIPAEKLPRVTEPFYMVDNPAPGGRAAAGWGLALCQRIAAGPRQFPCHRKRARPGHHGAGGFAERGCGGMNLWQHPRRVWTACAAVVLACAAAPGRLSGGGGRLGAGPPGAGGGTLHGPHAPGRGLLHPAAAFRPQEQQELDGAGRTDPLRRRGPAPKCTFRRRTAWKK